MSDFEQKSIFSDNLNRYLLLYGKTQKEVADAIHVSAQTFNTWCQGKALPRMGKLQRLADYFHIKKSSLIDAADDFDGEADGPESVFSFAGHKVVNLPVLGSISCGKPVMMSEEHSLIMPVDASFRADFILRASGNSMINARIDDGDLVFICCHAPIENGNIAAVALEDEALLKRFYYYPDRKMIILKAENPQYEDLIFSENELTDIHILGKAVAFLSTLR